MFLVIILRNHKAYLHTLFQKSVKMFQTDCQMEKKKNTEKHKLQSYRDTKERKSVTTRTDQTAEQVFGHVCQTVVDPSSI